MILFKYPEIIDSCTIANWLSKISFMFTPSQHDNVIAFWGSLWL